MTSRLQTVPQLAKIPMKAMERQKLRTTKLKQTIIIPSETENSIDCSN